MPACMNAGTTALNANAAFSSATVLSVLCHHDSWWCGGGHTSSSLSGGAGGPPFQLSVDKAYKHTPTASSPWQLSPRSPTGHCQILNVKGRCQDCENIDLVDRISLAVRFLCVFHISGDQIKQSCGLGALVSCDFDAFATVQIRNSQRFSSQIPDTGFNFRHILRSNR